ncbi:hypothetical protein [Vibrio harveyi]
MLTEDFLDIDEVLSSDAQKIELVCEEHGLSPKVSYDESSGELEILESCCEKIQNRIIEEFCR